MSSTDPFTKIINQILEGVVKTFNSEIGPAIHDAGYDPYKNVSSGSSSIGVGSVSYSITDLAGLSSFEIEDLVTSEIESRGSSLVGKLAYHAKLNESLSTKVGGKLKILFAHPGISGSIRISDATVSGSASVIATVEGSKVCITDISNLSADFNYGSANIWINDLGPLNYLLKPLESLILDVAKSSIRSLVSGEVESIVSSQLKDQLPQCASL
ncbi:hypothetical protein P4S72_17200 [Vibrio sp. PP-XX7]